MNHSWAFIYDAPETDPAVDRFVIDRGGVRNTIVAVPDQAAAAKVAVELVDGGVQFIELCGGFGPVGAAKVIEAVGGRVAVGVVTFGAESISKLAAVFAPATKTGETA
ncbi:MAG TPA: DUF6506 family protein [Geminicoccaceae bacterium]|nr:DUF6506 family protein [Geminicoccaceae bacterium]